MQKILFLPLPLYIFKSTINKLKLEKSFKQYHFRF